MLNQAFNYWYIDICLRIIIAHVQILVSGHHIRAPGASLYQASVAQANVMMFDDKMFL